MSEELTLGGPGGTVHRFATPLEGGEGGDLLCLSELDFNQRQGWFPSNEDRKYETDLIAMFHKYAKAFAKLFSVSRISSFAYKNVLNY